MAVCSMVSPLKGKVAVIPDEPEKISRGGIHLPEGGMHARQAPRKGRVIAVNKDDILDYGVSVGDRVLYVAHGGIGGGEIENTSSFRGGKTVEVKDFIIMDYDSLLAIIEEE